VFTGSDQPLVGVADDRIMLNGGQHDHEEYAATGSSERICCLPQSA